MARLLFMAILAIGFFTYIPGRLNHWLVVNGYMEASNGEEVSNKNRTANSETKHRTQSAPGRAVLVAANDGHYFAQAYLNQKPIRSIIDTGATVVALSYEDARRLGINPHKADYTIPVNTASGRIFYAPTKLRSVRIGNVEIRNLDAIVAPKGAMSITLIGMNYLNKLKSFHFNRGKLTLES